MRSFWRHAVVAAMLAASGGILTGALALGPALASGETVRIGPFAIVSCNSSSPCQSYENGGTGAGLQGHSAKGTGLIGTAAGAGNGVYGSAVKGSGVVGTSSSGWGVYAASKSDTGLVGVSSSGYGAQVVSNSAPALFAQSTTNDGVLGTSSSGVGVFGSSSSSYGMEAVSNSYADALYALAGPNGNGSGAAVEADGGAGAVGVYAHTVSYDALVAVSSYAPGASIQGSNFGLIASADYGTSNYPLALYNNIGDSLFYVDGTGNVFYHGSLNHFLRTRNGDVARSYVPSSTMPTVEDTGSAQLVDGIAHVRLDPAFAQAIDQGASYHVMLTPNGDTRGLYIASKGSHGFVVREVQGGHATIAFDYHIYAMALGHANERMVVVPHALAQRLGPRLRPAHLGVSGMKKQPAQPVPHR
jgi:hypothetical protein